jgi:hypothetical protein
MMIYTKELVYSQEIPFMDHLMERLGLMKLILN